MRCGVRGKERAGGREGRGGLGGGEVQTSSSRRWISVEFNWNSGPVALLRAECEAMPTLCLYDSLIRPVEVDL